MPRVLSLLAIFVFFGVPRLIGEQEFPSEQDRCQGKPPTSSCWMELSNQPGCYVWISHLIPDEARTWTGGCDGDLTQGPGYLKWFSGSGHMILEIFGRFERGKQHGDWVGMGPRGNVHEGRRVHGKKHGRWVERWTDGRGVHEGPYVDSKRNGHWVEHWDDGSIQEGPYVNGRHHGRWVLRFPDGQVQEGSFVEGKMHGRWILRDEDGNQEVVTFNNGEKVG